MRTWDYLHCRRDEHITIGAATAVRHPDGRHAHAASDPALPRRSAAAAHGAAVSVATDEPASVRRPAAVGAGALPMALTGAPDAHRPSHKGGTPGRAGAGAGCRSDTWRPAAAAQRHDVRSPYPSHRRSRERARARRRTAGREAPGSRFGCLAVDDARPATNAPAPTRHDQREDARTAGLSCCHGAPCSASVNASAVITSENIG